MSEALAKNNPNHDQFWLNQVLAPRKMVDLKSAVAELATWLPEQVLLLLLWWWWWFAAGTMAVVVTLQSFESPAQLATLRAGARGVPLYGLPRGASSVDTSNASLRAIYR